MQIMSATRLSVRVLAVALAMPALGAQGRATILSTDETATQFYMRYQAAIPKATKIDEILAFWSADLAKQFTDAPAAQRVDLEGIQRIYAINSNVAVVKEAATSTSATSLRRNSGADR